MPTRYCQWDIVTTTCGCLEAADEVIYNPEAVREFLAAIERAVIEGHVILRAQFAAEDDTEPGEK